MPTQAISAVEAMDCWLLPFQDGRVAAAPVVIARACPRSTKSWVENRIAGTRAHRAYVMVSDGPPRSAQCPTNAEWRGSHQCTDGFLSLLLLPLSYCVYLPCPVHNHLNGRRLLVPSTLQIVFAGLSCQYTSPKMATSITMVYKVLVLWHPLRYDFATLPQIIKAAWLSQGSPVGSI